MGTNIRTSSRKQSQRQKEKQDIVPKVENPSSSRKKVQSTKSKRKKLVGKLRAPEMEFISQLESDPAALFEELKTMFNQEIPYIDPSSTL